jgi:hypothetical protein
VTSERIQELAEAAGAKYFKDVIVVADHNSSGNATNFVPKFAELVAQECAKVCDDVGVALFAEPHQSNLTTAQTCALAIKKHFGVES